ncbi:MAG: Signal transduction response regulator [candidate division WS6 bacterium GW2011_GWF2_39_15]|uniref:Signal transduction response regulator n=1 Tax=candidate division WS6 bacterium GW2011_GWF2_39_15 TaxID=1619100 RepID=A0A0G0MRM6_9BACT|nr:MAG: Signal transduction response regulator [candidate division WS6 bacterium GW2011_GWF2_39_15]
MPIKLTDILKTYSLVLDSQYQILKSEIRGLRAINFLDLLVYHTTTIERELRRMDIGSTYEVDVFLDIKKEGSKPYKLVTAKLHDTYLLTLISLEEINELATTVETLEHYAYTDQLTGALNRHAYWKLLENLIYDEERENKGLGIVFVDLDNLKSINTTQGYLGGDRAIAFVAQCIEKNLRKSDLFVRIGGDEFIVIFKIDPRKDFTVDDMAQRILRRIRREGKEEITASIGTYTVKPGILRGIEKAKDWKKEWNRIIDEVDKKVKEAKRLGKNRVS